MDRPQSPSPRGRLQCMALLVLVVSGCATTSGPAPDRDLPALPSVNDYCAAAERVVTRTSIPMKLQLQPDFVSFVRSKALIEGPTIQQLNWTADDGRVIGISCKLKSTDHLLATFGAGSAGPDGACQDMNRAVYALVARQVPKPVFSRVVFDPQETFVNEGDPGMTGPNWLAPYTMTRVDPDGALRILTKGFIVNFDDPEYAILPARFRGVHYCHFIAPDHLRDLLEGKAQPGNTIGKQVELSPAAAPR